MLRVILSTIGSVCILAVAQANEKRDLIDHGQWLQVADHPTRILTWFDTASNADRYAVSLDGDTVHVVRDVDYRIHLRCATFDPLRREQVITAGLRATINNELYIVQFKTQPLGAYRDDLLALGCEIYGYVHSCATVVRMTPLQRNIVEQRPYVRWVGPLHPEFKANAAVLEALQQHAPSAQYRVQLFKPGHLKAIKEHVQSEHIVTGMHTRCRVVTVRADRAILLTLLQMNEVAYVEPIKTAQSMMDNAREVSGASFLELASPDGFLGQGVRGEIYDSHLLATHVDFQDPPILFHGPHTGPHDHGTHVFGIAFSSGVSSPVARGILPLAEAKIFGDWNYLSDGTVDRYVHTAELVDPVGPYRAVFQSNSWGHVPSGDYDSYSWELDDIALQTDLLICQSQGNTGGSLGASEAWAKNVVSVGGVEHYDTALTVDDAWAGAASTGPASDGRTKPDVVHFYDRVTSSSAEHVGAYDDFSGTSASTPIVAGYFGLLFQMWHEQVFPGHGGAATVFDSRPHAATAKAMMIAAAKPYPLPPVTDLSRAAQGWGLPDLEYLYDNRDNLMIIDERVVLENLQSRVFAIDVAVAEPELRVTMAYSDPPASLIASVHRVNDLTLKVTSPSGTEFLGNHGLSGSNWSSPGGVPDDRNTVENVFVQYPESGRWLIEVLASEVNEDAHLETAAIDADFGLVAIGGTEVVGGLNIACPSPGQPWPAHNELLVSTVMALDRTVEWYYGSDLGVTTVDTCSDVNLSIDNAVSLGSAPMIGAASTLVSQMPEGVSGPVLFQAVQEGSCWTSSVISCDVRFYKNPLPNPNDFDTPVDNPGSIHVPHVPDPQG